MRIEPASGLNPVVERAESVSVSVADCDSAVASDAAASVSPGWVCNPSRPVIGGLVWLWPFVWEAEASRSFLLSSDFSVLVRGFDSLVLLVTEAAFSSDLSRCIPAFSS